MKHIFVLAGCCFCAQISGLKYEQLFENEQVIVGSALIAPREEIGLHRDVYPQVVYPIKGGIITRIEANGSLVDVSFPAKSAVYRPKDPENVFHKSLSRSDDPIELLIVHLKSRSSLLVETANRYVALINKLSKGEEYDYFAEALTLLSPDCKKVFNGALVTSSCEQFVSDLLQVYKTHGSWHLTPVEIVPSSETNSVTILLTVDITALGKYTEMLLMKFDSNGLISEINIVFAKVDDGYSFDKE